MYFPEQQEYKISNKVHHLTKLSLKKNSKG